LSEFTVRKKGRVVQDERLQEAGVETGERDCWGAVVYILIFQKRL
jgi:hypothetical protein